MIRIRDLSFGVLAGQRHRSHVVLGIPINIHTPNTKTTYFTWFAKSNTSRAANFRKFYEGYIPLPEAQKQETIQYLCFKFFGYICLNQTIHIYRDGGVLPPS